MQWPLPPHRALGSTASRILSRRPPWWVGKDTNMHELMIFFGTQGGCSPSAWRAC